jgi:hypothetical protein
MLIEIVHGQKEVEHKVEYLVRDKFYCRYLIGSFNWVIPGKKFSVENPERRNQIP